MTTGELADRILSTPGLEGVTFVGGEPFSQAQALAGLAWHVRRAGLGVMTYTGYTVHELLSGAVADAAWLLCSSDLLMDGRYRMDLPTQKRWRGSDNQRLIALTDRYGNLVDGWNRPTGQDFEVRVRADGTLEVLGIPPVGLVTPSSAALAATVPGAVAAEKGTNRG